MKKLTTKQQEQLQKFKTIINKKPTTTQPIDDASLVRYLRARTFNLEKAEAMLEKTREWRLQKKPHLVTHQSDCVKHILPLKGMFGIGKSKTGMPILYVCPGAVNDNPVIEKVDFLMWTMENLIHSMGKGVEKVIVVFDFKDYGKRGRSPDGLTVARQSLSMLQNHYPERLGHLYVVNSPWAFSLIWTIVKPWIHYTTREKVHFIKGKPEDIGKQLQEHIDLKELGTEYGGTLQISEQMKLDWAKEVEAIRVKRTPLVLE